MSWLRQNLALLARLAVAVVFIGIALHVLANEFSTLSLADIAAGLRLIGWQSVGLALLATLTAYAAVASYDGFALYYAGRGLLFRRSAMSSTTTYAISNLLGFPVFTGNALRLWLFGHWGLGATEVVIAAMITTIVCNIVLAMIAGVSLIAAPDVFGAMIHISAPLTRAIGAAFLLGALVLTAFGIAGPNRIKLWKFEHARPGFVLIPHMLLCAVDYVATAAVLYVLLGGMLAMDFILFVALFSTAKTIGIFSNVPGGLGVFEAIVASTMSSVPPAQLAAALIAYRCIFYLAPFAVATAFVAVHGLHRASRRTSPRQPSTPHE